MCGIFGYVGVAAPVDQVVLGALRTMEYRGYDSWGAAFRSPEHGWDVSKGVGRVPRTGATHRFATSAMGHTRWATHGEVSERNAHPHLSANGRIAVVHNGIIENADVLKQRIAGIAPYVSDTDSEVMAHLVERELLREVDLHRAVQSVFSSIEGANAFVLIDFHTEEVVAITHRLPIRICREDGCVMLASDPIVFAGQAETILVLPDDIPVSLGRPGVMAESLLELERTGERVGVPAAHRPACDGPGSSMRAEIAEQPAVMERLASTQRAVDEAVAVAASARRIILTGCGSAFHAARFAADRLAYGMPESNAIAIPASDMADRGHAIGVDDVVIALTQSGETADVIDAVGIAAERGAATAGMVNVAGSSVARLVDIEVPLLAGTERSVLATKSFTAMLGRMMQFTDGTARVMGARPDWIEPSELLMRQAEEMTETLNSRDVTTWIQAVRRSLGPATSALVVGAGASMSIASEAALKIKEGTYVHAEATGAGELKHGVIALVEEGFPCLLLASNTREAARQEIVAAEVGSRGASVFLLSSELGGRCRDGIGRANLSAGAPFSQTMVVQMAALETALERGIDPDYPRNLAKKVTVR